MAATAGAHPPMTEHDGRVAWPACARMAWPACARNTTSKPIGGKTPATLRLPAPSSELKSRHPHPVEVRRRDPPGSDGLMAAPRDATHRGREVLLGWRATQTKPNVTFSMGPVVRGHTRPTTTARLRSYRRRDATGRSDGASTRD